jgi:ribonuclease P protein subunit POP4
MTPFFRWDAFVPLHRLWLGYMSELLGLTTVDEPGQERTVHAMKATMPLAAAAGMHAKLVKADFHGSIMTSMSFFARVSECFSFC